MTFLEDIDCRLSERLVSLKSTGCHDHLLFSSTGVVLYLEFAKIPVAEVATIYLFEGRCDQNSDLRLECILQSLLTVLVSRLPSPLWVLAFRFGCETFELPALTWSIRSQALSDEQLSVLDKRGGVVLTPRSIMKASVPRAQQADANAINIAGISDIRWATFTITHSALMHARAVEMCNLRDPSKAHRKFCAAVRSYARTIEHRRADLICV